MYDHFADRWVMVWLATNRSSESWILVSVSDDSDPNGVWCNWALDGDLNGSTAAGNWADYQGLGYDNQAVYIVPNQFKFGGGFDYSKIRILPKSTLYDNSCPAITYTDIWDIRFPQAGADAFAAFTIRPAVTFGTPGAEYLLANSIFVSPNNNFMVLYKLTNPLAASPTLTAQLVVMTATNVPPNANQKGGSAAVTGCSSPCLIDVGGNRIRNVVYRDGSVWTAHSVADSTAKYARARYVRIDVGGPTLLEDVSLGATECWYYYPAIAADVNSNMVMVFNRSCSDSAAQPEYAGIRYTSRLDGGTMESSAQLKAGETNYVKTFGGSRNRWGDYSGIAVDPSSPNAVWMFAEYAASPTNKWGTWFGQVRFPSAITSPSIIFPSTGDIINTGTPLFKWQAPATGDPSSYSLQVTSGGAFTQPFDINLLLTGDSPPPTQYQVQSADALADASYDWRVVAANTTGDTASSPTSSFTVDAPPAKVVLSSPANGSTGSDTTPTFTWGEVTDPSAVTYELEIGSGTADFSVLVFTADGIQQAQYTLSSADAQATGDYIWRVRANDGAGNTGDFSDPFTFTVVDTADTTAPAKVVLSSPANGSTGSDTTPTFAWGEVTDPSGVTYELEIGSGTADFSVLVFTADGIQQAQYTLSSADAQATGDYIWRVRANDGAGKHRRLQRPFHLHRG